MINPIQNIQYSYNEFQIEAHDWNLQNETITQWLYFNRQLMSQWEEF